MKYEIGDKVKIKTWEAMKEEYHVSLYSGEKAIEFPYKDHHFILLMENAIKKLKTDRIVTIKSQSDSATFYTIEEINDNCGWIDEMFEGKEHTKEVNRFELMDME